MAKQTFTEKVEMYIIDIFIMILLFKFQSIPTYKKFRLAI